MIVKTETGIYEFDRIEVTQYALGTQTHVTYHDLWEIRGFTKKQTFPAWYEGTVIAGPYHTKKEAEAKLAELFETCIASPPFKP